MKEEIFPLKDYKGYGITKSGKVWSYPKHNAKGYGAQHDGKWLKIHTSTTGYYYTRMSKGGGKSKLERIHRLLAIQFIEKQEGKDYINHKDGNKLNNSIHNLEWCTISENNKHGWIHGKNIEYRKQKIRESLYSRRKFNSKQIEYIKKESLSGRSRASLGRELNVSATLIFNIVKGVAYA